MPLSPSAPITPATCVPCPSPSVIGSPYPVCVPVTSTAPPPLFSASIIFGRSSWRESYPVSITQTFTGVLAYRSGRRLVRSHTSGTCVSDRPYCSSSWRDLLLRRGCGLSSSSSSSPPPPPVEM